MLNPKPFAAALAAISLACAGNAAAQTDVLVVEGTSVGILGSTAQPAGANQSMTVGANRSEPVRATTPLDDARLQGALTRRAEPYLELRLHDTMISSYSIGSGGAKPPVPAETRQFSASPASTRMFNAFANFGDVKGESTSGAGGRALTVQQLPAPSAPQRPPIAGTSNTPMIGDRLLRPAAGAPVVRR